MHALQKLLHRKTIEAMKEEGREREFGQALFTDWRDRYIALLCNHIRLSREAKGLGLTEIPFPTIDWCNAAVHLLTHGELELQDYFLRASMEEKSELVRAVIQDQGIEQLDGFFVELPPC